MNVILHCLLVDIAVAIAVTALYALTDEIALSIIYGKNKVIFDRDYYADRLLSVFIIGLIPIVGFVIMMWWLWTLSDRVEAFVYSIIHISHKRHGVIVKKKNKIEIYSDWIFV